MNWWQRQSTVIKASLVTLAAIVALLIVVGVFAPSDKTASKPPAATTTATAKSNVFLVASQSFCVPTGIDDAYTGDGHVTFFLTFRNTGTAIGTVSAVPVRHYDDGELNDSPLDEVEATIPSGRRMRFHTPAFTYKAHSHEVTGCGVMVDGRAEVSVAVQQP